MSRQPEEQGGEQTQRIPWRSASTVRIGAENGEPRAKSPGLATAASCRLGGGEPSLAAYRLPKTKLHPSGRKSNKLFANVRQGRRKREGAGAIHVSLQHSIFSELSPPDLSPTSRDNVRGSSI